MIKNNHKPILDFIQKKISEDTLRQSLRHFSSPPLHIRSKATPNLTRLLKQKRVK
jgi:hypothetical protein